MADDVAITPGAGATVAADDVGGKLHQRVKVSHGADGSATDASSASPLPTTDAAVLAAVDGVEAALANLLTELGQKLEATDLSALATAAKQDTSKAVLDTIAGKDFATQTTLAAVLAAVDGLETNTAGLATQTTLAAILAKLIAAPATEAKQDSLVTAVQAVTTAVEELAELTEVQPVSDNGSSLTVDAPLGTPVATRLSDGSSALGTTGGRLHVDDGGQSLTVDGTLALDAATLAALETIGLDAATLAALESITIGTALPAGTNAIGKLAANSGVDIGDVDVTSVPADPFGANADAAVAAGAAGSIQAKLRRATQGLEDLKSLIVLAAGSNIIGKVGHANTGVGSGRKVVTTAGTRVALASTTAAKVVFITAETDNTGYVVVGSASGVIAALATREGVPLAAGDTMSLEIDDLADVGLDSMVNGDGVTYTYLT